MLKLSLRVGVHLPSLLIAGVAGAIPRVYHSPADDGTGGLLPPWLPPAGSLTLHLYMDETDGSAVPSLPAEVCTHAPPDEGGRLNEAS